LDIEKGRVEVLKGRTETEERDVSLEKREES
jgi:hypothetical protein